MTWLTPMMGLVLGAVTIPILLLLYFLRLRRQPVRIASTMLWERAVEDLHANSPFQRLRPSLLLILQLLALILVIVALMQPQVEGGAVKEGKHVILIDRSASMNAEDVGGGSRLEQAKEKAIELVHQLHGGGLFGSSGGETMVITFSDHAEIVIPFTDSDQQLTAAIQSIQLTHGRSSIEESLKLARAYTTNIDPEQAGLAASEFAKLELFSDGRISDFDVQALQRGETLTYHKIGSSDSSNVGVSTISAKRISESSDEVQVFLTLVNTGDSSVETDVQISVDGIPIGVQRVAVPQAEFDRYGSANVVFVPFPIPHSGVVQASIIVDDPFMMDDVASLVISPPKELRVLVSEDGPPIVHTILEGMPLAELKQVSSATLLAMLESGDAALFDVIVARGVIFDSLPQGHYLLFGAPPPIDTFSSFVKGEPQIMLVAREEHPVMRFVRYEDVVVSKGYLVVLEESVEILLEGSSWPAVMNYRKEGIQTIYVAFDPIESNWPYLRSFPFFVYNAVQYLGRGGDLLTAISREVGQSIVHEVPQGSSSILITEPDGQTHTVDADPQGYASWGPIRLAGLHQVTEESGLTTVIAINSPIEESLISSLEEISIGATTVTSTSGSGRSYIQLWPWALGAVLAVLIAEWWVYQKKVGGFARAFATRPTVRNPR